MSQFFFLELDPKTRPLSIGRPQREKASTLRAPRALPGEIGGNRWGHGTLVFSLGGRGNRGGPWTL